MKKMLTLISALSIIGMNSACNAQAMDNDNNDGVKQSDDIIARSIITTLDGIEQKPNTVNFANDVECQDRYRCDPIAHIQVMSALKFNIVVNDLDTNYSLFRTYCDSNEYEVYLGDVLLDFEGFSNGFDVEKEEFNNNAVLWTMMLFRDSKGCEMSIMHDNMSIGIEGFYYPSRHINTMMNEWIDNNNITIDFPWLNSKYIEFRSDIWIENGQWIKDGRYDNEGNYIPYLHVKNIDGEMKFASYGWDNGPVEKVLDIDINYEKSFTDEPVFYKVKAGELYKK